MWLVGGVNGVSDASGTKYETPRPADGATATVRRPAFVTRGETSEPGSLSLLSGATTAAVASAHVWNGAVNGDTARTRNTNAHTFLRCPTVNIVAGNGQNCCVTAAFFGVGWTLGLIGLLNLGALRSPVAPSAYVTAPMLCLLALLAAEVRHSMAMTLGAVWVVIMGPTPLPVRIDMVLVLLGQGLALALGIWVLRRSRQTTSKKPTLVVKPMPA